MSIQTAIKALESGLDGRLIRPGDADYDAMRAVLYGGMDFRPAAISLAKSVKDIQKFVATAAQMRVEFAIRSGGHSAAGHSSSNGGLVLDLREMKAIDIDEATKTVWAETGLTAIELTEAVLKYNLVVGFGDAGTVGLGGITLGGGVGYLSRKWGLTIDSLLAAEIVTADGKLHTVDATHEPDLFWAIRGGGGNFGVVTRLQFQARELAAFTGGLLVLPGTAETIAAFTAAAQAAPEALSTIATVMPAPPAPFIPDAYRGQPVIFAMMAYAGPDGMAEAAMVPFRALSPLFDAVKPGPLLSLYEDGPMEPPGFPETRTFFVDRVSKDDAQTILGFLTESDSVLRLVQIRVLGGAANRVAVADTAYAHRGAPILLYVANFYSDKADRPKRREWADDLMSALQQGREGAYVNFLGDEGAARTRSAYPGATWERLRRIKRQYDPQNLFRRNQNIPPAAE